MKFVILTGMSGAGKSTALKMMEDIGFYCVDNLPIPLLEKFVELSDLQQNAELQKVAVGIDIRSGQALEELRSVLDRIKANGGAYDILFLDAEDSVLVKRYKETRRSHPLAGSERVDKGIAKERERLAFLKERASYIIDTSQLLTRELKAELDKIFVQDQKFKNLMITVLSFGFKYGIPADSDLVFDVRFLPNPYYVEGMRPLSGNDAPVRDYVMGFETAQPLQTQPEPEAETAPTAQPALTIQSVQAEAAPVIQSAQPHMPETPTAYAAQGLSPETLSETQQAAVQTTGGMQVTLNDKPLTLPPKAGGEPYYLMDLLEFSNLDFDNLNASVSLRVNGEESGFLQEIRHHDVIEIKSDENLAAR